MYLLYSAILHGSKTKSLVRFLIKVERRYFLTFAILALSMSDLKNIF